jgi:tetraacyldisaccharide 4'-kinase
MILILKIFLPAGNLRESRRGAKRADLIVVTKCPEILTEEKQFYINKIKPRHYQKFSFLVLIMMKTW